MTQYTIGILPSSQVISLVEEFSHKYPQHRHTSLPPHIPLYPPFTLSRSINEKQLIGKLESATLGHKEFSVEIGKLNTFSGDKVVFLEPTPYSSAEIYNLAEKIKLFLHDLVQNTTPKLNLGIQAHITLAKQIPEGEAPLILHEAQKIPLPLSFLCNTIVVFKKVDDRSSWKLLSRILLS